MTAAYVVERLQNSRQSHSPWKRRPVEPRARAMYLQTRARAFHQLTQTIRELSEAEVNQLATYALAGADGLFIANEIGGDSVDLVALFELHGRAVVDSARRLIDEQGTSTGEPDTGNSDIDDGSLVASHVDCWLTQRLSDDVGQCPPVP